MGGIEDVGTVGLEYVGLSYQTNSSDPRKSPSLGDYEDIKAKLENKKFAKQNKK